MSVFNLQLRDSFCCTIIVASRNILEYSKVCHKMKNPFELKLCRNTNFEVWLRYVQTIQQQSNG